jgi:hypothetical protein
MESAETTSPPRVSASSTPSAVLPEAVGPESTTNLEAIKKLLFCENATMQNIKKVLESPMPFYF